MVIPLNGGGDGGGFLESIGSIFDLAEQGVGIYDRYSDARRGGNPPPGPTDTPTWGVRFPAFPDVPESGEMTTPAPGVFRPQQTGGTVIVQRFPWATVGIAAAVLLGGFLVLRIIKAI